MSMFLDRAEYDAAMKKADSGRRESVDGVSGCTCEQCLPQPSFADITAGRGAMRMILCQTCGNKRCPHATDHRNACTGSNLPGQPGSSYA